MFLLKKPAAREIEAFLDRSRELPLSYQPVGLAVGSVAGTDAPGAAYQNDEHAAFLGTGAVVFRRAAAALDRWSHFDLGWVQLHPALASTEPGTVVAVVIGHLGFWSINGARVVYQMNTSGLVHGFAYGTLSNHAEAGEEIFKVSMDATTGRVAYTIRAASRPRAPLARAGYPITRLLQARFRRDSAAAMIRACRQ
jgi:uncharacterized protein (UPF0548 family)